MVYKPIEYLTKSELRTLYKKYYGFKPCNMSEEELLEILKSRILKEDAEKLATKVSKVNKFSNTPKLKEG